MGWLEYLGKILPVEQVYKDVAQPAAKEVGEVLQSTVRAARFAVAPIEYLAAQHGRWKRFIERLSKKVPEENLIEAHPQLAGPVFDGLRYVEENNIIAELFLNLLARAIDKQRVSEAHPAFAQIIGQLSPDEAIVIFKLEKKSYLFRQYAEYYPETNTFAPREFVENEFPVSELAFPENFNLYMDHLHSLNLAGIWQDGNQEPIMEGAPPKQTGVKIKSISQLTTFGRMFAKACVPESLDIKNV